MADEWLPMMALGGHPVGRTAWVDRVKQYERFEDICGEIVRTGER